MADQIEEMRAHTDPVEEMNQMRGHKATLSNPRSLLFTLSPSIIVSIVLT
jgi:hypothetical protein